MRFLVDPSKNQNDCRQKNNSYSQKYFLSGQMYVFTQERNPN
jgi:hypothetical protein